ncbi:MAG: cysteine desulfurase family protein [Leptothrix sp. (in: b-proteobacteria)]
MIYLDHNATTRVAPEALQEMLDVLERAWANPSSTHEPGQAARRILSDARSRIATFLGCQGAELIFTSGATESNHTALLGALKRDPARRRLVLSAVEHPGLLALAERLKGEGVAVDLIPVGSEGQLDLDAARDLIGPDVALVSVMGANNETGVLMPIQQLAEIAHAHGVPLHVDATQLIGKSALSFADSGADLWSVSAHKLHGPKGIGALLLRKGLAWPALLSGRQERNRRGGTENLPGIAGFAAAAEHCARTLADDLPHMQLMRERLEAGLLAMGALCLPSPLSPTPLPQGARGSIQVDALIHIYGAAAPRLPNTCCVRFGRLPSEQVLGKLERAGVVASSGAACTASGTQPSHVLLAMGASADEARSSVRFSLGRETSAAEIDETLAAVRRVVLPLLADSAPLTLPGIAPGAPAAPAVSALSGSKNTTGEFT